MDSLTPTWTRTAGSGDGRRVAFAHPGCRDYVLSRMDDEDIAAEFITEHLKQFEQLSGLTHATGVLTTLPTSQPTRPQLAAALNTHRKTLAGRLETWWSQWEAQGERSTHAVLLRIREVTKLCGIFGDADTSGWLVEKFRSLTDAETVDKIACVEGIAAVRELAAAANTLGLTCDTLISDLLVAAISHANSTRDLEACESLPDALNRDQVWETTRQRAALIMSEELKRALEDDALLDEREEVLYELESRSGFEAGQAPGFRHGSFQERAGLGASRLGCNLAARASGKGCGGSCGQQVPGSLLSGLRRLRSLHRALGCLQEIPGSHIAPG
jgi:hypothetical protein